jgi:hypothetical protein
MNFADLGASYGARMTSTEKSLAVTNAGGNQHNKSGMVQIMVGTGGVQKAMYVPASEYPAFQKAFLEAETVGAGALATLRPSYRFVPNPATGKTE